MRGFTIVEVLIVVAIVGVLLAAGMPAVADMIANGRVRSCAEQVRDGLAVARNEAIRRNAVVNFVPDGTGWIVVQPGAAGAPDTVLVSRGRLGEAHGVVAAPSADVVSFTGRGRLASATSFTVALTQAGATCAAAGGPARCLNVGVGRGGAIRTCDPALPVTHPEAC